MPTEPAAELESQVKQLLTDSTKRIELDDFISMHVDNLLEMTGPAKFPLRGGAPTKEDVVARIARYEETASDLQKILTLVAKWVLPGQANVLENSFSRLGESEKGDNGLNVWVTLTWYPTVYLIYAAGLAALASKNYNALSAVLLAPVEDDERGLGSLPIAAKALGKITDANDPFQFLPGLERRYTPRSEHVVECLRSPLEEVLRLGKRYEILFDRLEVLFSLIYADAIDTGWVPVGRFGWKHVNNPKNSPLGLLKEEMLKGGDHWALPLFGNSVERIQKAIAVTEQHILRLGWH